MTFCNTAGWVMGNGFSSTVPAFCPVFLFEGFVVRTATAYALTLLLTFALGVGNELLRHFRVQYETRKVLKGFLKSPGLARDSFCSLMYLFQMVIAYWLMLLVMLYDLGYFTVIVVGLATGNLITRVMQRHQKSHASVLAACCNADEVDVKEEPKEEEIPLISGDTPCCRR